MKNRSLPVMLTLLVLILCISASGAYAGLLNNATGGTMSTVVNGSNIYTLHTYNTNGTFTPNSTGTVEVLVIAGGGSGGSTGGGGGGGGVIYNISYSVYAGQVYNITIGNGAKASPGAGLSTGGFNGGNTTFGNNTRNMTALGGGAGGGSNNAPIEAAPGGSGGGADQNLGTGKGAAPTQTSINGLGYGNYGGNRSGGGGGGGGGAGAPGGNSTSSTQGGAGGAGMTFNLTGTATCYAGGGGGGTGASGTGGTATCGGSAGTGTSSVPSDATANTGGGSGASGYSGTIVASGNGGSGLVLIRYTISTTATPTWVAPTPANGTTNSTQVILNASSTTIGARYTIWFDTNPNPSTIVVNNASTGNWTTNVTTSGTYYYKAGAWNASTGYSTNTSVYTWTYDVVNPTITINPSNQFNAQNFSLLAQYNGDPNLRTLVLNFTFADNHQLYGFIINITRGSTIFYNETNSTLNVTTQVYNRTLNVSSWPAGTYNISIEVDDTHTSKNIQDYVVSKNLSGLRFQTDEGNDIAIISINGSVFSDTRRLTDRYTFRFNFLDRQTTGRSFIVHAERPLEYIPNSGFKAHFIVLGEDGMRGNWIDFEGVPGTPIVRKLNPKNYLVTFTSLDPDVEFQSVGGLNVIIANYTFYLGNETDTNQAALATDQSTFVLNMSRDSTQTSINVTLVYNGTVYTPTMSNGTGYITFTQTVFAVNATGAWPYYWNITVTQGDGNTTNFNISRSHSVQLLVLSNCGTNATMNFTVYNENAPQSLLAATIQAEITYWSANSSVTKFFNTSGATTNTTGFAICLTPSTATFYANVYVQDTVAGTFTHRFYINNGTYNNVTANYSLYNWNTTTGASDLEITTRYISNYAPFPNVYVTLQRRYLSEGIWRNVQMYKSGDYGLVFFDIRQVDTDYRMLFYDVNNTLLKQTDTLSFACDAITAVCQLTQLLDPAGAATVATTGTATITYDNATKVITVTWVAPTAASTTATITVTKESANNQTTICSVAQTGAAGSTTCNVSVYTGTIYTKVSVNNKPALTSAITVGNPGLGSLLTQAEGALWTFFIMLAIVAFGLFSPVGLVIATMFGLVAIFFLGIFTPLTITFVIIAAVIGLVIGAKVKS